MATPVITTQTEVVPKTNIGPGAVLTAFAQSFTEGQLSLTSEIGAGTTVVTAQYIPATLAYTNGTTGTLADIFVLANSMNSSGTYSLLASSTTSAGALVPSLIKFNRNGTNAQDGTVLVLSRS